MIFEDGLQQRDFVSMHDVATACRLALTASRAPWYVFNIGSGRSFSVCEVAERMACTLDRGHIEPEVTGNYRVGDIRHCFADISLAHRLLGYQPQVTFESGLTELAAWLEGQVAIDRVAQAREELTARGVTL